MMANSVVGGAEFVGGTEIVWWFKGSLVPADKVTQESLDNESVRPSSYLRQVDEEGRAEEWHCAP